MTPAKSKYLRFCPRTGKFLGFMQLQGRKVALLVNEWKNPGAYSLRFDGSRLARGVYLLRLTSGDPSRGSQTRKMVVEK